MSLHIKKKIPYREYPRNGFSKIKETVRTIIKVLSGFFLLLIYNFNQYQKYAHFH